MKNNSSPAALGTEKISKLLIEYSVPAIIAMMASSLYNIVDSIFIGHGVGAMAISGLAVTFPLINLAAAFGSLVGAGGAALISIKMGQRDEWGATQVLGNVLMLNIILSLALTVLGLIFLDPILYFFGASENTVSYARDYMEIILWGNVVTHLYLGLNSVMRSSGYPQKAMVTTLLTVLVNAVLDPVFIFWFGWGIRGAAIATVLAQIFALVWVLRHFVDKKSFIRFHPGIYRLKRRIVSGIFSIGMSPFMLNLCSCLVVILINNALKRHGGDLAIGAYGIINRIIMLFGMVVLGFNQGMQPIAGYNFGAKQFGRVSEVLKRTIVYATGVTTFAFIVCMFFPEMLSRLFTDDAELIALSVTGMRIIVAIFPIVGFQMVVANFFQSIGKAYKAVFLSSTRQLLFLIPLLLILPNYLGLNGVWLSMPISDGVATIVAAVMLWFQFRKFKEYENEKVEPTDNILK